MNPTIIRGPVGDDPPEAKLFYGKSVIDALRLLPDNSINTCCTSPPFWGLRDYGVEHQVWGGEENCDHDWTGAFFCSKCGAWKGCLGLEPTPDLFVEHMVLIGREIRRVLHPSGTFWLNLGDSYAQARGHGHWEHRGGKGNEYGQKMEQFWAKRDATDCGLKPKDLVGIPWRTALALQADGWWLRNDIIWQKKNTMPSSVADRFSPKHEHVFLFAKQSRYFFDLEAVRVPHTYGTYKADGQFEPAQQWFESGEGDRKMDQTEGQLGPLAASPHREGRGLFNQRGKNPGDIWSLATSGYRGAHFAVWPPKLVERFIKAGTSEKGRCPLCKAPWERILKKNYRGAGQHGLDGKALLPDRPEGFLEAMSTTMGWQPTCECTGSAPERCVVLDPFSGSGTTGMVSMELDRDYVGLDLNPDYLPLAKARLEGRKPPQPSTEANLIKEIFG